MLLCFVINTTNGSEPGVAYPKRTCWSAEIHVILSSASQHETRVLRVKVIAGIDLAKKDIIGAR